jgi:hypothetical protein
MEFREQSGHETLGFGHSPRHGGTARRAKFPQFRRPGRVDRRLVQDDCLLAEINAQFRALAEKAFRDLSRRAYQVTPVFRRLQQPVAVPRRGVSPHQHGRSGKVTIRLAAPAARPLLPENPVFTGYTLDLINRGQVTSVEDVPGINTACVTVELGTGTWIAVVKGFQEIGEVPTVVIERQGT